MIIFCHLSVNIWTLGLYIFPYGTYSIQFFAYVQTGPGAYPASYTMGTGSFPGVKRPGRGADHPPPSSAEVKERVELYLYSPSGPSWPVIGKTLLRNCRRTYSAQTRLKRQLHENATFWTFCYSNTRHTNSQYITLAVLEAFSFIICG
jgi:hypothetical protein